MITPMPGAVTVTGQGDSRLASEIPARAAARTALQSGKMTRVPRLETALCEAPTAGCHRGIELTG